MLALRSEKFESYASFSLQLFWWMLSTNVMLFSDTFGCYFMNLDNIINQNLLIALKKKIRIGDWRAQKP